MSADHLTISLNDPFKTFVLEQAAAEGYPQPADYVSALIDAERRRKVESELEALLVEGLESGPSIEADEAYWQENRRKLGLGIPARKIPELDTEKALLIFPK